MKRCFFFFILFCVGRLALANPIALNEAKQRAETLLGNTIRGGGFDTLELVCCGEEFKVGYPLYYVFSSSERKGYVVVSGDDCITPILGYSKDGIIDESLPDNMKWWLSEYESQMEYAIKHGIKVVNVAEGLDKPNIGPLLTCKWDQGGPYNDMCPTLPDGNKCMTGCVATAMTQIMYYHKWPNVGWGSNEYESIIDKDPSNTITLSADFSNTYYRWNDMLDNYGVEGISEDAKSAVAELMLHCGVALEMYYGKSSSPLYVREAEILKYYFRYDFGITQLLNVSDDDYAGIVYQELQEGRPVYVGGTNEEGERGHAFVCDGYQDGLFHFNWGWSGAGNGYFALTSLTPPVQDFDFSYNHRIIYNIKPNRKELPLGEVSLNDVIEGQLKDDVIEVNAQYAEALKISGKLNGTDFLTLRELSGRDKENKAIKSAALKNLDLSNVSIIPGGEVYCYESTVTDGNTFPDVALYYTNIESIKLPNSVTAIGDCSFELCGQLTDVEIGDNIQSIGREAFGFCTSLRRISLPSSLKTLSGLAFRADDDLAEILSNAITPPSAKDDSFTEECYNKAILFVPYGTREAYKTAKGWKNFVNIIEMETSLNKPYEKNPMIDYIYTIDGKKLESYTKGINLVRYRNGSVRKVFIE